MRGMVRVGGIWLDSRYPTTGLRDSTIWRRDGWSGDYQAQVEWAAPPNFQASWLRPGAQFEVFEDGLRTWNGLLAEPEIGDAITLHAYGFGVQADEFRAVRLVSSVLTPSYIPDEAIDAAVTTDGLQWRRFASIGTTSVTAASDELLDLTTLLNRHAQSVGKRWVVDTAREITEVADPTSPKWIINPDDQYLGTTDDQYVTNLYGFYVSAVDGTTGLPSAYGVVESKDVEAATKFVRKAYTVDLTPLGLMTQAAAQANIDARFSLIGGRMGWTNGVELTGPNLRRFQNGAIASPMSVRAGDMLRIPGVMDARSQATTQASVDIVLGEVTRYHDEQRATATPVGFSPRDFQGALNSEAPKTSEAA